MPDSIERLIYKLELDDSGYIAGAERLTESTTRLSEAQIRANQRLQNNQAALRDITAGLARARQELETYTGTNQRFRRQLEGDVKKYEQLQEQLIGIIKKNKEAYDEATKAAQNLVDVQQKQPTGLQPTPIVPPQISDDVKLLLQSIRDIKAEDISNLFDGVSGDFEAFRSGIQGLEQELGVMYDQLEETVEGEKIFNEEFKNLALVVTEGKKVIEEFDKQTAEASRSALSYRQQITIVTKELQAMQQANKENTEEYKELFKESVRLRRAQQDHIQTLRILSSETRLLDFGRSALTTATAAFQTWTSVAILAGGASEDLQKKTFQLFAAMQLLTSIETLNNQLKRVSVLRLNALAAAQTVYTAAIGASTGALRAFRIALLATGVGVILVGIGLLIARYAQLQEATRAQREEQRLLNEVNEEAIKSFSSEVTHLTLIKTKLNDLTIPQNERIKLAKEYNKVADEGNKIDLKQIDNINLVNLAIDTHIEKIKERARARAAENIITKAQEQVFLEEEAAKLRAEETAKQITDEALIAPTEAEQRPREGILQIDQATGKIIARAATEQEKLADRINSLRDRDPKLKAAKEKLQKALDSLGIFITPESLVTVTGGGAGSREVENIFAQELERLLNQLQQLRNQQLEGFEKINAEFGLKFQAEQQRIAKLLKDKKIKEPQAAILIEVAAKVNREELDKALNDFYDSVIETERRINDDIEQLRQQNQLDSINLIENEFDRRRKLIEVNEQQETQAVTDALDDRLKKLKEEKDKGLINEREYADAKKEITEQGEIAQTNIVRKYAQQRSQLAFDTFKQTLENLDDALTDSNLIAGRAELTEITALVDIFKRGEISYEEYRKRLAAIQKKYDDEELQRTIDKLTEQLRRLKREQINELDETSEHYKKLLDLIRQKEKELQAAQGKQTTGDGGLTPDKRVETVADYAEAIGRLTESVIAFWQKANEAEAAALDRSIALQEKRVDEAQKIAERGNASYLKMEEDRLKQLQIARENAARRELAINAAIQASQIMVGITGAIAKIAKGGIGIAETIASIAVIVSSLAAGFALVRTLQNNQPRLARGEKYVKRKREPAGIDTIPAWLTEGEAVIPRDKNKAYHPTVEAIFDGTVPPDYLNNHVQRYHKLKSAPNPNYDKIKSTADMYINTDRKLAALISEQNEKIDENNDLQRQTLRAMKNMSVNAKIDRDGVAIAVNEYIEKMKIDRFV